MTEATNCPHCQKPFFISTGHAGYCGEGCYAYAEGTPKDRPIPFPGYLITRSGEVFSTKTKNKPPRRLATQRTRDGYVSREIDGTQMKMHKLVALYWLPAPEPKQVLIRHLDGNRANNAASNLKWGTNAENRADTARHEREDPTRRQRLADERQQRLRQRIIREQSAYHQEMQAYEEGRLRLLEKFGPTSKQITITLSEGHAAILREALEQRLFAIQSRSDHAPTSIYLIERLEADYHTQLHDDLAERLDRITFDRALKAAGTEARDN